MSKSKFHFVIPAETGPDSLEDQHSLAAVTEECRKGRCKRDPIDLPRRSVSGKSEHHTSAYNAKATIFDSTRHRLHGVIHSNGHGHLLRINGMYGGSKSANGLQILALWDQLCTSLLAQKITVEDVSSKAGMELRIAYFLAYGQTWYGLLGYDFGRGPYNIDESRWRDAGTFVSSILLSHILHDFEGVEDKVPKIIKRYMLPVKDAARVKDFGALLYRLLYLQLNPEDAKQFFDSNAVAAAQKKIEKEGRGHSVKVKKKKKAKRRGLKFSLQRKRTYSNIVKEDEKSSVQKDDVKMQKMARSNFEQNKFRNGVEACDLRHKLMVQIKSDPSLPPNNVKEIQVGSRLEILYRGDIVEGTVAAAPLNRGRMHTVTFKDGKTRKFDLQVNPWRLKNSLAPMTGMSESNLRNIEVKEEAKLESIKNSRNNSTNPSVLRYKANLSREDFVERARQLCRALKSLIPSTKVLLAPAKTRLEMEQAFSALVGDGGPKVTCVVRTCGLKHVL